MNGLRLWIRYAGVSVRAQAQYPASFVLSSLGNLAGTSIELAGLWAAFHRFGSIRGWRLPEVLLLYGLVSVSFAIAEAVARGFDEFAACVRRGDFDRVLLRPRSAALQVVGEQLLLRNVGRLAQGVAALAWATVALPLEWTAARVALLLFAVVGGACLFAGLLVLQATLCFWTTESLEVVNCLTYGGVDAAQLPLTIYNPWFRRFFTYVVPLAAVTYFPGVALLGRADPLGSPAWLQWACPVAGVAFLLASLQAWRLGILRYRSTGS